VVFDYRGFDTLGESAVLFTAVVGVALIFRRLEEEKP
jgi:multisubunit Na+/H+ antiporter MnhB subunit